MASYQALDNFGSANGKIEYLHGDKALSVCAFEIREKSALRLLIPRSLGTTGLFINVFNESLDEERICLDAVWDGFFDDYDIYFAELPVKSIGRGLYFFHLTLQAGTKLLFGFKSEDGIYFTESCCGNKFQLSISAFKHSAPRKKYGGIIYHIFVDRFNRGGEVKKKKGTVYPRDWNYIPEYPAYAGAPLKNNTFWGGTLWGIVDKLDYIASLGVDTIYLSPIFDAASNHKYDTGDYLTVDSMFGGTEALVALINEAKKKGIGIILDGVFNHTGSDSKYFNREGNYDTLGAYESKESEFYSWYDFQDHPNKYTCWWGIEILPRINPSKPECREYFVGEDGVIETYARMGIDGFRLDVVDELPDEFVTRIKDALAKHNKESVLYGEVWEDASNKIAYDSRKKYYLGSELDGVMNYPIRKGIISYLTKKDTRELHYALTDIINNAPPRIGNMQMNLLGTHDTERIITVLGAESSVGRSNDYLARKRMNESELHTAKRRLKLAYTILATVPGIPVIFYGDEAVLEGYHDPFNRMPYPWGKEDAEILSFYRKIGNIRRTYDVYKTGEFRLHALTPELLIFSRYHGHDAYTTIINNSSRTLEIELSEEALRLISGNNAKQTITIAAYSSEIIKSKQTTTLTIN